MLRPGLTHIQNFAWFASAVITVNFLYYERKSISLQLHVLEQLQNTPVKSRWGRGFLVYASSFSGARIVERGNLLCTGYVWIL